MPLPSSNQSGLSTSERAFEFGVRTYQIEGRSVRVTGPAKTVVDCFKFRNTVGLEVALEALRDYRSQRRGTLEELFDVAGKLRMARVMQPYVEALA